MEILCASSYLGGIIVLYKILDYLIRIPKVGNYGRKYILVTGCDTGFGHETAKRLDELGCHVFAACLTDKGETELKKQCSSRLKTLCMDISDCESVRQAYAQVEKDLPEDTGLWGIVNNAGIPGRSGPDEWLTLQDYKQVMDVNAFGTIDVTMTFLPLIKRRGGGRIVNMSSVAGRSTPPCQSAYAMSKHAVEVFSDSLRSQVRVYNISVHLIEPGYYKTPMMLSIAPRYRDTFRRAPLAVQQQYGDQCVDRAVAGIDALVDKIASDNLQEVVAAYEHALLGRCPRGRYMVMALVSRFFVGVLYLMPEWFADWLLAGFSPTPACVQNGTYKKCQS